METKLSQLLKMIDSGDWNKAIRFAAKFPQLGNERNSILRAKDALGNPDFYRQIGKDPEVLIREGQAALVRKYVRA